MVVDEEHSAALPSSTNDTPTIAEVTINDRLGHLFMTAVRVIYRTTRRQCDLYENAVGGRDVAVAISKIASLVLPPIHEKTSLTVIQSGRLCSRCNTRVVFRPCGRVRIRQIYRLFNKLCIVCFVIEKVESSDPITVMQQLDDISKTPLTCSCHQDIMLLALSSIPVLGGDNTRRILTNSIINHMLHKVPSLTLYDSLHSTSTVRRLSEIHRKIAIISNTLMDHLFICVSDRARLLRYIMCCA